MYAFNYETWAARDDDEATDASDPSAGEAEEIYLAAADLAQMRELELVKELVKELDAAAEGAENALADLYDPRD